MRFKFFDIFAMITILIKLKIFLTIFEVILCDDNSVSVNKTRLLNENCVTSDECNFIDSNAKCDQTTHMCICSDGYYANSAQQNCAKYKKFKEACETDDECLNAYCSRDNVCVCKPGSVPTGESFDTCSYTVLPFNRNKFGERCNNVFECDPEEELICMFYTCACKAGFVHKTGGNCVKQTYSHEDTDYNKYKESKTKDYGSGGSSGGSSSGTYSGSDDTKGHSNQKDYSVIYYPLVILVVVCVCIGCVAMKRSRYRTPAYQNNVNVLTANPYYNNNSNNFNLNARPFTTAGYDQNVINNSFRVSNTNLSDTTSMSTQSAYNVMPTAPPLNYPPQHNQENEDTLEDKPPSYVEAIA